MIVQEMRPEHLELLVLQDAQEHFKAMLGRRDYAEALASGGPAFAVVEHDRILACIGVTTSWDERQGRAWALMAKDIGGRAFLFIHKRVQAFLRETQYRRIEAVVDCGFHNGHRWAWALGFRFEGRNRAGLPDGRDCDLFAYVKE